MILKKLLLLIYLLLIVFVLLFASPEDFTQRATCECYYKFENGGDLGEDNQNQIDLTNNNAVAQNADIPSGTFASPSAIKSADFERDTSMSLSASHADSTEVDDLTAITVVFWVKLEAGTSAEQWLFSKCTATNNGWFVALDNSGDKLYLGFGDGFKSLDAVWADATWYFVAFTYDGNNVKAWRGAEEAQVTQLGGDQAHVGKTAATTDLFYIGKRYTGEAFYTDGKLCEVMVFSEALTLNDLEDIQQYGMEGGVTFIPKVIIIR